MTLEIEIAFSVASVDSAANYVKVRFLLAVRCSVIFGFRRALVMLDLLDVVLRRGTQKRDPRAVRRPDWGRRSLRQICNRPGLASFERQQSEKEPEAKSQPTMYP